MLQQMTAQPMILGHHKMGKEIAKTREVEHQGTEGDEQQLYDSTYDVSLGRRLEDCGGSFGGSDL